VTVSFSHVCLNVEDLDAARDFFVDNFGYAAQPMNTFSGGWVDRLNGMDDVVAQHISLTLNGSLLELLKFVNPPAPPHGLLGTPNRIGYRHIALTVDDIDGMTAKLQAQGWSFVSPVQTVPEMKVKTVYFFGPEGILLQMMQPL